MSERHLHTAASGICEYDRAMWLEPPSETVFATTSKSGISGLCQIGHSADASVAIQETQVNFDNRHGMIFFPDGWEGHEVHVEGVPSYGRPGLQCAVISPGIDFRWITHATRARAFHLHLPASQLVNTYEHARGREHRNGFLTVGPHLKALANAYIHDLEHRVASDPMVLDSYAILLACYFYTDPANIHQLYSGGLSARALKAVQDYLLCHLCDQVALAELAAIADLSPHHFCRAFKQSTGLPPHAWLTARRMERAQELMAAHPKMGLTEVALCVGYQSQAAFGVAFRRATGSTPGQWRRERAG